MFAYSKSLVLAVCGLLPVLGRLDAEPVPVRYAQGALHAFLILKDLDGRRLAAGDLTQTVRGSRVTSRLTFHFRDGSLDDELTVFTQHGTFKLVSDRHVQKGPSFPKPIDATLDVPKGMLTSRFPDKDGHVQADTKHLDLEPDIANGLAFTLVGDLPLHGPSTRLSYLSASTSGGRLVHLLISPVAEEPVTISGVPRKAMKFSVHIDIGGLAGVVASMIGKQPADLFVWVLGGEVPAILATEGPLYEGGPVWRIELDKPDWPRPSATRLP